MAESTKIKVGDVVKLRSGGPHMTVVELYNNDEFTKVVWFNTLDASAASEQTFPTISLKSIDD